ncbi:UNVERIFIED_CONTAM: hypothetical protein GTU68_032106, partial [Idotea baltica]|nr:hypothetical protein [Idotea baltica]
TFFSCNGRGHGYYADVETNCLVFHLCTPTLASDGRFLFISHHSFICPKDTLFSQDVLSCQPWQYAYPCDQAESIYQSSNVGVGVQEEKKP